MVGCAISRADLVIVSEARAAQETAKTEGAIKVCGETEIAYQ